MDPERLRLQGEVLASACATIDPSPAWAGQPRPADVGSYAGSPCIGPAALLAPRETPVEVDPEKLPAILEDTNQIVHEVLAPGIACEADQVPQWYGEATLSLPDGTKAPFDIRFARSNVEFGLVAHARTEEPIPNLAALAAASALNWPKGYDGMGRVESEEVAGGTVVRHGELQGDREAQPSTWSTPTAWPFRVGSWSDGEWWALYVVLETRGPMVTYVTRPLELTGDFLGGPGNYPRGKMLQDARPGLERRAGIVPVSEYDPTPGRPGDPDRADIPAGLRATRRSELDWTGGVVREVPSTVSRLLGCPDIDASWQVDVADDPELGGATIGMLDTREPHGRLEWSLGLDYCAVTYVPEYPPADTGDRVSAIAYARFGLDTFLGEHGTRLSFVPLLAEPVQGIENAWLLTPDPDYEVGLVERVRVGDTPWGRCRIYVDPAVLHVVFDLDDAE